MNHKTLNFIIIIKRYSATWVRYSNSAKILLAKFQFILDSLPFYVIFLIGLPPLKTTLCLVLLLMQNTYKLP